MLETHFSCDDRGLWLAILSSLLCPEVDWKIRVGKQGYVFKLTDLSVMFWCFIPDINQYLTVILRLGQVKFLNKLISETFCVLSLLNSRYRNGFRLTKTNFVFWFSLAEPRLLENFFWIIFLAKRLYLSSSCFSNLFNASARLFCTLSFAQSRKILSKFSKLSVILKHGGKNFAMITSIVRLSSNRS